MNEDLMYVIMHIIWFINAVLFIYILAIILSAFLNNKPDSKDKSLMNIHSQKLHSDEEASQR